MSGEAFGWARRVEAPSAVAKAVLLLLADSADHVTREAFPGVRTMARELQLSDRSIQNGLRQLEEAGLITLVEQRTRSNKSHTTRKYALNVGGERGAPGARHSPGEAGAPEGVNVVHRGGERGAPLTTFEPSREPSEEEPSEAASAGASAPVRPSDWTRADLDRLEARLREAAGASINPASPNLINVSAVVRLLTPGAGPACDLELDVLAAIRARAAKIRAGTVKSWDYFSPLIVEARDARLSGAPIVKQPASELVEWDDDVWEKAVEIYYRDGSWGSRMGPKPEEVGCIVPANILNKYIAMRDAA